MEFQSFHWLIFYMYIYLLGSQSISHTHEPSTLASHELTKPTVVDGALVDVVTYGEQRPENSLLPDQRNKTKRLLTLI